LSFALIFTAFAGAALGAIPVGSEFQVNTYTTNSQSNPSVAAGSGGGFVVVWESYASAGSDTSYGSIQGQRYDASGNPLSSEFQVNTYTTDRQVTASVAADAAGDFVVVWQSVGGAGSDTDGWSIQGQRYDATGNLVGSQFQVNTYTALHQMSPSVAVDEDGDFVVVWYSWGSIYGQRYDGSGNPVGSEFQVNTYTTDSQNYPSVAADAAGNFVVVWEGQGGAGSDTDYSIQGRRYDASGNALGPQFQVNTYTTSMQWVPSVAVNADGNFVVVWSSYGSAGSDTDGFSAQGQRYDAGGNAVGTQFQINTYTTSDQGAYSVAFGASGDFVVLLGSDGSTGTDHSNDSIQSRRYDASGNPLSSEFQVNTYTTGRQLRASVAADAAGDFEVVWQSAGSAGSDTDGWSIQGQRYTVPAARVPSLRLPGVAGLAVLLLGIAAAGLRGRLGFRN